MALSGRKALLKVTGAGVSFTDEATTTITANTVYQITNAAKQVWDRTVAIVVKKDTVVQASTLYTVNRLTGTITFLADIGGGHTITVSGTYLPVSTAAQAKDYTHEMSAQNLDVSKFGDTYINRIQGLKDVAGTLSDWKVDNYFHDALLAGNPIVLEFWLDSGTSYDIRVWSLLSKAQIKTLLKGALEEAISFTGTTDVDSRAIG